MQNLARFVERLKSAEQPGGGSLLERQNLNGKQIQALPQVFASLPSRFIFRKSRCIAAITRCAYSTVAVWRPSRIVHDKGRCPEPKMQVVAESRDIKKEHLMIPPGHNRIVSQSTRIIDLIMIK